MRSPPRIERRDDRLRPRPLWDHPPVPWRAGDRQEPDHRGARGGSTGDQRPSLRPDLPRRHRWGGRCHRRPDDHRREGPGGWRRHPRRERRDPHCRRLQPDRQCGERRPGPGRPGRRYLQRHRRDLNTSPTAPSSPIKPQGGSRSGRRGGRPLQRERHHRHRDRQHLHPQPGHRRRRQVRRPRRRGRHQRPRADHGPQLHHHRQPVDRRHGAVLQVRQWPEASSQTMPSSRCPASRGRA